MRSMFSGVSSLRVHQTRMDVIANNIANVNTDGFKAQRATFADAFYQNLQGASGPDINTGRSGMNPRQVGLGLNLASIDNLMHQGIARRTDNALDVAIEGGGFFIVQERGSTANMFTRAGRIERDAHWNLHIGGNALMGWSTMPCRETPGGHAVNRGVLQPLRLDGEKLNMPSEPTTAVNITGNLNRSQLSVTTDAAGEEVHYRIIPKTIFDSLGNRYEIAMRFVFHEEMSEAAYTPHGYWTMEFITATEGTGEDARTGVRAYIEGDRNRPALLSICMFGGLNFDGGSPDSFNESAITMATIAFDSAGNVVGIGHANDGLPVPFLSSAMSQTGLDGMAEDHTGDATWMRGRQFNFSIIPLSGVAPSATFGDTEGGVSIYSPGPPPDGVPPEDAVVIRIGNLAMDFRELGQRGAANTSIRALTMDGGGPGTLTDISVGPDGTINGRFSNGRDRILGQIPLAFFTNPAGLERVGNSFWRTTANSGPFDGVGLIGDMIGGALEGSNVDLASEFTDMIVTQRGFQAASRTITVSDEMIQELVNLRR